MIDMELNWTHGLLAAAVGTYVCRGLGVFLSGRIDADGLFFRWVSCVTYAMVAALTMRLLVFPVGLLQTMPLALRMLIAALGVAFMWLRPQASLLWPLAAGMLATLAYGTWVGV
ncbi:MAG: hypothetical protein RL111_2094 [Pseudomonadota bacterium]|jgi:branched-subunit amino acid transport protein